VSDITTQAASGAATSMAPVRPHTRIQVVDILRGFAVLGILLMNMQAFAGYQQQNMPVLHQAALLVIRFVAQAKFYTLFSFLFGWGMAVQMMRATERGRPFGPFFVRRMLALLLIGLVHTVLIWDGDILVSYAVLGLPLLLFRKASERTLLIAAGVCLLIPVLISLPGPAAELRAAYGEATYPLWQPVLDGHQAQVLAQGSYVEAVLHRVRASLYGYSLAGYWATHVFGMFLLGLYAGRRGIFHDVPKHLPLFRKVMWVGLVVGVVLNLLFVATATRPELVPVELRELATRGARTIGGSALSLFYVSVIVLLTRQKAWRQQLSSLASVGRMALSNYLLQSVVCTLIFYGYGLGLYGRFGPAVTVILTLVIYRIQMGLSGWWLDRYRFGPAEWLWRLLTYGKPQSLLPDRARHLSDG
jgi:uncharacterized protein